METKVTPAKYALCINRTDAPSEVQFPRTTSPHLLTITDEFFDTPTRIVDRAICETDERTLQLLPYVMVLDHKGRVFMYSRGKGGAEERLHAKLSIGVGGHMDTEPFGGINLYRLIMSEAIREVQEELGITLRFAPKILRLIMASTPVDLVHLGILCVVTLPEDTTLQLESGVIENGEFVNPASLVEPERFNRLENWSKAAALYLNQ